jgi:ABC-type nickel/cobalt efflux system permease component RcnA
MRPGVLPSVFLLPAVLFAHPMGSSSVNHYARIEVAPRGIQIRYVLDFGETASGELLRGRNFDAEAEARAWSKNLIFRVNGRTVEPHFEKADAAVGKGEGGEPVVRVTSTLSLAVAAGDLEYEDRNFAGVAGWKEIVIAAAPGAGIAGTSAGTVERSRALTAYPAGATREAPQDLKARLTWTVGDGPSLSVPSTRASGEAPRDDFLKQLLHRGDLGWQAILIGMAVAFGLGAMHALSPGHGKTIVAAYLVGNRGTARHALFLGAMVTFTHTFTVFALGLTTMYLYKDVLPERVFPVLGTISGLSIVWVGAVLLYKRTRSLRAHAHTHDHGHDHDHGPHGHSHVPEGDITMGSLIALGASGGLVPCPSALVILLSSIALGRVALGLLLLVGFSLGLAVVLMGIGLIVLYAKNLLPDTKKTAENRAFRIIPVLSAAVIVCLGLLMTGVSLGVIRPNRFIG